ncbi:MAG: hypothetical protein AAGG51_25505, partial [Cyanobacteria bacterium P01_G01_bin.54]
KKDPKKKEERDKLIKELQDDPLAIELKGELNTIIKELKKEREDLSINTLKRARVEFYIGFLSDFQDRVFGSRETCTRASYLYESAMSNYIGFYQGKTRYKVSNENAFIIIEIGHWLINRDAGSLQYDGFDGYSKALELYELLPESRLRSNLKYNLFVSEGIAWFHKRRFKEARDSFAAALKVPIEPSDKRDLRDLRYNLASMEAQIANYQAAIDGYMDALNSNGKKTTKDIIHRDLGFAYLLLWKQAQTSKNQPNSNHDNLTYYFNNAIKYFDLASSKSTRESIREASLWGLDQLKQPTALEHNSLIDQVKNRAFGNVVSHDLEDEPVLDIYHDLFYCSSGDKRLPLTPESQLDTSLDGR